jgi:hypothetical protein
MGPLRTAKEVVPATLWTTLRFCSGSFPALPLCHTCDHVMDIIKRRVMDIIKRRLLGRGNILLLRLDVLLLLRRRSLLLLLLLLRMLSYTRANITGVPPRRVTGHYNHHLDS